MSIRKSLESSFSLTFALYAAFFISFVYSIILVRVVNVEVMGMIGMGGTFIEIVALVSTLGTISIIQTYTTYYLSRNEYGHLKYILKKCISIILTIAGVASILTFIFSREISSLLYNTNVMALPLKVIAAYIIVNISLKILGTILRASGQFNLYGTVQVLSTALNLLLTLLFIYILIRYVSTNDDAIVAGSFIASTIVTLICITLILIKNRNAVKKVLGVELIKPTLEKIYKFGASTMTLELISMWGVYINTLAVGFFLPPEEWGYYTIALMIMGVVTVFKTVLNIMAYPAMVDAHSKGDIKEFNLTVHIMFKYWTLFFVPLIAAFILFLPYTLPVVWGTAYEKSIVIAQILLAGFVIQYYSSIYLSALTATEKPHRQFMPTIVNVVLNVVLGITLVYFIGILGAAITILITSTISFFLSRYIFIGEQSDLDVHARTKFAAGLLGMLALELIILGTLFIPCWLALGLIPNIHLKFIVAMLLGAFLTFASISYIFGRRKLSDEEITRIFDMFPQAIKPILQSFRSISTRVWRG